MPRPKKIVTAVVEEEKSLDIIEIPDILEDDEEIIDVFLLPEFEETMLVPVQAKTVETNSYSAVLYNVYQGETLIASVKDGSPELLSYLEVNHNQLMDWIDKLTLDTDDEEDLALFNIPFTHNRVYKSLKQYYLQNGFAPKPPKITSWMHYYLLKHPMMTAEEIAIEVFGPLTYSFSLA